MFLTEHPTEREHLLRSNLEQIEVLFEKARAGGMRFPVVLVLDLRDENLIVVAEAMGNRSRGQLRDWVEVCLRRNVIPVHVLAAPADLASQAVAWADPDLAETISRPCPAGHFYSVAINDDGASAMVVPAPRGVHYRE